MKNDSSYEKITRTAYQKTSVAEAYKKQYTHGLKWARLTMWVEQKIVCRALEMCALSESENILDLPCGTGVSANSLINFPAKVFAADISQEMMKCAAEDYRSKNFKGFVQADITKIPFKKRSFSCIVLFGLMHRIPQDIRAIALRETASLTKKFIIVNYSVDSPVQKIKRILLKFLKPGYVPAPSSATLRRIYKEIENQNLTIKKAFWIIPFFSSQRVFFLEKHELHKSDNQ